MKVTTRFMVRAALVLTAGGVIGAFGACKDGSGPPPPVPPPPPPTVAAPTGLTATAATTGNRIDLAWTDNANNETGFRVERCTGPGCTTFAQVGANTAVDVKVFADTFGLAAATSYSYRVRAFNATDSSAFSATASAVTGSPPVPSPIFIGAGEITSCASSSGPAGTAAIVQGMLSDPNVTVFSAGNALLDPAATTFDCFDSKWGSFKDRTIFALGTGDYTGRGSDAVYTYFGDRTGPRGKGYWSFDTGNWHVVVLNTTTYELGAPELINPASSFNTWLVNDLQANTKPCVLAISWERRLYTSESGSLGRNGNMKAISEELYAAGVDVLVSANDHVYERFPQTDHDGVIDTAKGFRQFIVGTGGTTTWSIKAPKPQTAPLVMSNVESQGNAWGLLKLTLGPSSYKWEFVPSITGGFTDSGETSCH